MNKVIIIALAALFLMGNTFAVNPNLSIDYVRMLARYATVNSSDAAIYNPAGLPKLENGLHLNISNQFVYKKYGFKPTGMDWIYNGDPTNFSAFFPSGSISFKHSNWAVFFNFTVPDGGGDLKYTLPAGFFHPTAPIDVEATSQWFDLTLGGSYAINDMFALSLGARMLLPSQTLKQTGMPELAKWEGMGFSGQFGVNITPIEHLNIGILYKSQAVWVKNEENPISPGKPGFYAPNIIQVGIGYDVIENLNVQFGYKINLESLGDGAFNNGTGTFEKYNNSMDFSLGAEYQINSLIKPSLGVAYQMTRGTEKTNTTMSGLLNPDLNAFAIGLGAVITPIKNLNITVGYMIPIFFAEKYAVAEFKKDVHVFGIGVSYKFF